MCQAAERSIALPKHACYWALDALLSARTHVQITLQLFCVADGAFEHGQVYLSRGKSARRRLTDALTARVVRSMKQDLNNGNYDVAIQRAVVNIGHILAGTVPREFQKRRLLWKPLIYIGLCLSASGVTWVIVLR